MAEVLSPPMQPSSTIAMLHSRPSSSDAFQGSSQQYSQSPRIGQQSRSMYNNGQNNSGYRGTGAPVQPYAFQSTPHLRQETRTVSAPSTSHGAVGSHRHAHTQSASASSTTSSDTSSQPSAKDDSVMGSRNGSLINLSSSVPDLSLTSFDYPAKPSPDRYRRPQQKRTESGNTTPKAPSPQLGASAFSSGASTQQAPLQRQGSVDDLAVSSKADDSSRAKRYRRRSLNNLDTSTLQAGSGALTASDSQRTSGQDPSATSTPTTIRPVSLHERKASDDSQSSQRRKDSAMQESAKSSASLHPDQKGVHIPPRTSSEAKTRMKSPSPLSREAVEADDATPHGSPQKPKTYAAAAQAAVSTPSPAAAQLAAVSDKDLNKGMKSRLRRAFSFGSAQELKRAGVDSGNNAPTTQQTQQAQQAREQHQQHIDEELDAEQQEIARRQEAAGIGAGIYSGQGGFIGSTDNLSISSTASSASMMLRKMGRGAKKSARSIKGLFRPKSVIGVPAADGPVSTASATVQPSVAQVSMVTVEAERQKVNVTEHPGDKPHGITGFPKLERNSLDAVNGTSQRGSADGSDSHSRRSIVGSDRDRAEVLAAVKKGILKRSGTNSPTGSPTIKPNDVAGQAPTINSESPASSMPSTPKDGQSRNDSMKNATNGDYFSPRLNTLTKSMPPTPNGSVRTITFSPRIQFHDAWSSSEYDRRGEIATCNRLTPMLAQQIKEELNTFKMEMEVHESSKPHTHFF